MQIYILIPFGVFFVCGILQFLFLKQIRDALIERHPNTYLEIEKGSFFPLQGLQRFLRRNRYKALDDADLNKRVRNFKRLYLVAIGAWLCFASALFTAPMR